MPTLHRHRKVNSHYECIDSNILTGRKCDGYKSCGTQSDSTSSGGSDVTQWRLITPRSFTPAMQQPRVGLRDDEAELRFWDHYRTVTAPALSGSFDADFWSRFLVRVSHEEPSVRHAIIALSFLHQKFEGSKGCITNTRRAPLTDPANGFALRQYNKAIGSLRNRMHGEPEQAQKATILTCIVFIIIEFIQGKGRSSRIIHAEMHRTLPMFLPA